MRIIKPNHQSTLQSLIIPLCVLFSSLQLVTENQTKTKTTMKKLYRKGTVHPSPPTISDQLSFLPATILTLTVALSPEDREVLAYLISCSSSSSNGGNPRRTTKGGVVNVDGDHPPLFHCSCFRCYMSYWARWDSSPNHQLIHEIIDAFEDSLAQTSNKKVKRNKRGSINNKSPELKRSEFPPRNSSVPAELESVGESSSSSSSINNNNNNSGGVGEGGDGVEDEEKGSVRRFVSFIGERIWGAWGQ